VIVLAMTEWIACSWSWFQSIFFELVCQKHSKTNNDSNYTSLAAMKYEYNKQFFDLNQ
jgi:hypothetical protein